MSKLADVDEALFLTSEKELIRRSLTYERLSPEKWQWIDEVISAATKRHKAREKNDDTNV